MKETTVEQSSVSLTVESTSINPMPDYGFNYEVQGPEVLKKLINNVEITTENPISFWKRQLEISNPLVELATDFPRSLTTGYQMGQVPFSLSTTCVNALKQVGQHQGTTLFTTLLAAYKSLLYRYTNQKDIVVGLPTYENIVGETGELIVTLHNTKLSRTNLSGNLSFNELINQIHQASLYTGKLASVSFESLEEAVKLADGINQTGLYNIIFSHRNDMAGNNTICEWASNISIPENSRSTIEIALYAEETAQGLNGMWTYNSELFEVGTITRLAQHYEVLLESIISNSQQTISQLQLLTDEEKHQLTSGWNRSEISYPTNKCIHELFEAQTIRTPGATALIFGKKRLTYAELNKRSNQVAHYLRSKGVKKDTLVAIDISRSLEMVIGILGILKAGAAYVPIDPNWPIDRMTFVLNDTEASLIVCDTETKIELTAFQNIDIVELSVENSLLKRQPTDNLDLLLSPNSLAYIIYTSGSTGKPKGVMIEHRSLADHCYGMIENANLRPCKSFALFSPLIFDAGHSIIHSSLILGACMHILSEEFIMNGEKAMAYIANNRIDCIKIVPSLWLSYANLKNVILPKKVIIFGGETFNLNILNYLIKANYGGNVYNHYGPTEVTIGKCIYKVDINKSYHTVPIGKPFSNTQLYILDDDLQLVPVGVEGELYVAGDGLARGYLNQPNLTYEKFISNPFTSDFSGRMYKTGDKVRWLTNKNIEYIGRTDEQVKIAGHRIELGEIEEVLLQSGLVRQAVVLSLPDKRGDNLLVEYVVPDKYYTQEALTSFLRKRLPDYMIPVKCIEAEKFPLTGNGKINKKELKTLGETDKIFTAPKNDTEAKLATIWQEV